VETVAGVLLEGVGRRLAAVDEGRTVVPGAEASEEGATGASDEGWAGAPELGGATGASEVGASGGGAMTLEVGPAGGWLLRGAVAVDSTEEGGRPSEGAYVPGGVGAGLMGAVTHSVTVTVTVTSATQAGEVSLGCTSGLEAYLHS
jgi:hypothetical protein